MYRNLLFVGFTAILFLAVDAQAQAQQKPTYPKAEGFTFLLNVGPGQQFGNSFNSSSQIGQQISLGIGTYVKPNLAFFLKASMARSTQSRRILNSDQQFTQNSAFLGASAQYWISDRFYIEGGAGAGFLDENLAFTQTGFATLFGAGVTLFENKDTRINLGIENTLMFIDSRRVHNVGLSLGIQLK